MIKPKSTVEYFKVGKTPGQYRIVKVTTRPDGTQKKATIFKRLTKMKADNILFELSRNPNSKNK